MNQKELINSIKQLKEIKPRREWAILLKSQILTEQKIVSQPEVFHAKSVGVLGILSAIFFAPRGTGQRKLAYAFTAALALIVGVFSFANYTVPGDLLFPVKKIAEQSQAALTGQTVLKHDVAILNSRINDLAQVAKDGRKDNIPSAISEVNVKVSELSKSLKNDLINDSQTIKEIATSLKTLANIPGTDLTENPNVKDLYQTIVQTQIADLGKTILTDNQKIALDEIKELYLQGKYTDALEKILLTNI